MAEKLVRVECVVNNVHTTKGKMVRGQTAVLFEDEAKLLKEKFSAVAFSDTKAESFIDSPRVEDLPVAEEENQNEAVSG